MSYIGEFSSPGGLPGQEYMLRVLGKAPKGHFFLMLPSSADLDEAIRQFAPISRYPAHALVLLCYKQTL